MFSLADVSLGYTCMVGWLVGLMEESGYGTA